LIAKEDKLTNLILGILLLAFGILVQVVAWNYMPIWYHLIFLALLIPMTMIGGKLLKSSN
jgi:TRAP-type C4-dicarboxylate transport system permease small subunit